MLAYVYEGDKRLTVREVDAPAAAADNAILQVAACAICGSDVRTYLHGTTKFAAPRVIGHEMVGTLTHVGKAIEGWIPGQRVAIAPALGCGACRTCRRGFPNMCEDLQTLGFEHDGGFAEQMAIPPRAFQMGNVHAIPDNVDFPTATLAEPVACCINAQEFLHIGQGDSVVVFGGGFIGCMHIELARRSGATTLILFEPAAPRAEAARAVLGDAHVLDPLASDAVETVRSLTDGAGADVVITACPIGATHAQAVAMAAKRGRISLFGGIPGDATGYLDSNLIHYKELAVYGVHASTPEQNRTALQWIAEGSLPVERFTDNRYPLRDIDAAFKAITQDHVTKAIVQP